MLPSGISSHTMVQDTPNSFITFGGEFESEQRVNGVWRYDTTTNVWDDIIDNSSGENEISTFGDSPRPGSTTGHGMVLIDNETMVMFGGYGADENDFGDVDHIWLFNPVHNVWFFLDGNLGVNPATNYSNGTATPGGMSDFGMAIDRDKWVFYVYGGYNYINYTANDGLWKYDLDLQIWEFLSGSKTPDKPANFTEGYYHPGGLYGLSMDISEDGQYLYIFGGSREYYRFNNLWRYNLNENEWEWLSGSKTGGSTISVYNTGEASPGGNTNGCFFWYNSSSFFYYGGFGFDGTGSGFLNDLWRVDIETVEENTYSSDTTLASESKTTASLPDTTEIDKEIFVVPTNFSGILELENDAIFMGEYVDITSIFANGVDIEFFNTSLFVESNFTISDSQLSIDSTSTIEVGGCLVFDSESAIEINIHEDFDEDEHTLISYDCFDGPEELDVSIEGFSGGCMIRSEFALVFKTICSDENTSAASTVIIAVLSSLFMVIAI
eukprot:TRINITY_DN3537_c0_g1_i1.p1 TRINITY_DN3537_c0_g1~~TRINITY_DN3537_c0_g1_i1.p1  ORF type:complete len:495 (-),score=138.01 TRINITY_DN3537_c0_g1_i1:20-1504(-)